MSSRISRVLLNGSLAQAPGIANGARTSPSLIDRLKLQLSSDEELAAKLSSGNAEALTVLFDRYRALLFHNARRILRDTVEAEDAVQQVFFDLYRSVDKFDERKASFKAWLLMFAYCRFIDRWRQLQSSRFYDSEMYEEVWSEVMETAQHRTNSFHHAETLCLVEQALRQIQPRQRRTIELVYYDGLTAVEIAERTGESVRVVRHNLYRGLEKLRSVLGCEQPARVTRSARESGTA